MENYEKLSVSDLSVKKLKLFDLVFIVTLRAHFLIGFGNKVISNYFAIDNLLYLTLHNFLFIVYK